jgi:hypothetical protein
MQIPGKATNPNPANSATGVGIYDSLSWTGHPEATSHDVYFGTSASPPFIQNQTGTVYDPVDMLSQTIYYWRINEKNAVGTTTGDLWSFTTGTASPPRSQYEFSGNFSNSITGPDATPYGNASIITDPNRGQCLNLDGTGDYIDCGYTAIANIETAITLACWVKTSDFVATDGIMTNGYSWKMAGSTGGVINFTNSTLSVPSFSGSIGISDGLWHHVAVTYDSVGQLLAIYVDGELDASTAATGVLNTWQGYRHLIGWCSSGPSGYFTGLIDDARVYDRALPQPEIAILAESNTPPPPPDNTPPTPDPMTWATVPYATSSSSIAMVATTATDISGVEYYFDETSGNAGGSDSAWQSSTSYTDTGLSPSTQYTYKVQARDSSVNHNATAFSTPASATTLSLPLFSDGFESGNFTAGGWTTQNSNATVSTKAKYTGAYGAKLAGTTWMQKAVSTVGKSTIHVKYARKTTGLDAGENLYVEWSIDGSAWNNLETVQATAWASQDITCGSGANNNANFRVRWRTNASSASNEYAYIDDVVITGI